MRGQVGTFFEEHTAKEFQIGTPVGGAAQLHVQGYSLSTQQRFGDGLPPPPSLGKVVKGVIALPPEVDQKLDIPLNKLDLSPVARQTLTELARALKIDDPDNTTLRKIATRSVEDAGAKLTTSQRAALERMLQQMPMRDRLLLGTALAAVVYGFDPELAKGIARSVKLEVPVTELARLVISADPNKLGVRITDNRNVSVDLTAKGNLASAFTLRGPGPGPLTLGINVSRSGRTEVVGTIPISGGLTGSVHVNPDETKLAIYFKK